MQRVKNMMWLYILQDSYDSCPHHLYLTICLLYFFTSTTNSHNFLWPILQLFNPIFVTNKAPTPQNSQHHHKHHPPFPPDHTVLTVGAAGRAASLALDLKVLGFFARNTLTSESKGLETKFSFFLYLY